jgi:hypothetical protein
MSKRSILILPSRNPVLTIAAGSGPGEIASKFLKTCWLPLLGMVTWEKT